AAHDTESPRRPPPRRRDAPACPPNYAQVTRAVARQPLELPAATLIPYRASVRDVFLTAHDHSSDDNQGRTGVPPSHGAYFQVTANRAAHAGFTPHTGAALTILVPDRRPWGPAAPSAPVR